MSVQKEEDSFDRAWTRTFDHTARESFDRLSVNSMSLVFDNLPIFSIQVIYYNTYFLIIYKL